MPQPQISTNVFFGNSAQPNGQGLLPWINLADFVSWFPQEYNIDGSNRQLGVAQSLYRAKGVYVSDDFGGKVVGIPARYFEGGGTAIGAAKAQLSQAGEQWLTLDNKVTASLAKFKGFAQPPKMLRKNAPMWWEVVLEFYLKEGWFRDLASTAIAAQTLIAPPQTAPSAVPLAGGGMTGGSYRLAYTFVTASGETAASPFSSPVTLSGGSFQLSVAAVVLPAYATAVKWYCSADSATPGFAVQNANGNAFTLNTNGNGVMPPASTPATQFSVAYAGSVFGEPVFTVTIPAMVALAAAGPPRPVRAQMVSTAAVSRKGGARTGTRITAVFDGPWVRSGAAGYSGVTAVTIANTMSGETVTVSFPGGLDPLQAWTITVDCGAMKASDQNGKAYDTAGTAFPQLYPPAGQANPLTLAIVQAGPPTPTVTLAGSVFNRWEL